MPKYRRLILILGDQLTKNLSSLKGIDKKKDAVLMMEVTEEATYVKHHLQKIILIFSAMRHFSNELRKNGIIVHYQNIDEKINKQSFEKNLKYFLSKHSCEKIYITEPGEYRVLKMIKKWQTELKINVTILPDNRFYCSTSDFKSWSMGKKQLRMENFYRMMRKKHNILMENDKPIGNTWNFDQQNRKTPPKKLKLPKEIIFTPDEITSKVIDTVKHRFNDHFGDCDNFNFATNRKGALKALNDFVKNRLSYFGPYQDIMMEGEYILFHSVLSAYINIGLLSPKEVVSKVEKAYQQKKIPINSAEGFIRQILGWREFVRGIYWLKMPEYSDYNALSANNPLPDFYWSGETKMSCMKHVITQTIKTATSHHIQRLMVTGNFALLFGVKPAEICEWYLAVYADAFEWVELPNTLGMSQFADEGLLASKPYACSGNYINKMSNFCDNCCYNVKEKFTKNACPFNYLYWAFLHKNKKLLSKNPRLKFAYTYLNRLSSSEKKKCNTLASQFIRDTNQKNKKH